MDSDKDLSGEKLSIIVLEEHLMQTYIAMLEKGTSTDLDEEQQKSAKDKDDDGDKDGEGAADEDD